MDSLQKKKLVDGLWERWETLNISIKLYPSCHLTHGFVDAAKFLRERRNVRPEGVRAITCYVPEVAVGIVCEPRKSKLNPKSDYDAKFSLPFTMRQS